MYVVAFDYIVTRDCDGNWQDLGPKNFLSLVWTVSEDAEHKTLNQIVPEQYMDDGTGTVQRSAAPYGSGTTIQGPVIWNVGLLVLNTLDIITQEGYSPVRYFF